MSRLADALRASPGDEESLRSLVESSADGVLVVDADGTIALWNPAIQRLFGYASGELAGANVGLLLAADDARRVVDDLRRAVDGAEGGLAGRSTELEGRRRDGSSLPLLVRLDEAHAGEPGRFVLLISDLSQHARALNELRIGRDRLELALAAAEMGAWEWDVQRDVVRWSEALERIHGLEPGAFAGTFEAFARDILDEDRERVVAAVHEALAGADPYTVEYRICRPDGELRWIATRGTVARDGSGAPVRMLGVCADVTERRLTEQRFEQRFAQLGAIYRMTEATGRADALEQIYEEALQGLEEALSVDRAAVLLTDPDGVMRFKAWRGLSAEYRAAAEGHSPWAPDDPSPAPVLVADVEADGELSPLCDTLRRESIRALVFLPLVAHRRLIGELVLCFSQPYALDEDGVRLAQAIASTIAVAIDRRRDEDELARLLEHERVAREAAERAISRLARLQSLTSALAEAASVADVAGLLVREGADAVGASAGAVFLAGERGEMLELVAQRGYSDAFVEQLGRMPVSARTGAARAFRRRRPLWYGSAAEYAEAHGELADFYATLGYEATVFLPLVAGQETLGVFAVSFVESRRFPADERDHLTALGGQCAQALERASLFQRSHAIAETLQRSILPRTVPAIDGLAIATSYLPGTAHGHVGGDWYDVIDLERPSRATVVVGDVEGKGVEAAAVMAQLRFAVQGYLSQGLPPAAALQHLNRLLDRTGVVTFATVVAVELDPDTGALRWANAGHPPPLAVDADGRGRFLEGPSSLPLGVDPDTVYQDATAELERGAALVLYTDGLVERRGVDMGARLERLRRVAARSDTAVALRERILEELVDAEGREDDIALVVAQRLP